jgi:hypothetical protein
VVQIVFNPAIGQLALIILMLLLVVVQIVFNQALGQLPVIQVVLPVVTAAEPPAIARKVAAEENPERIINPKEGDTINKSQIIIDL